MRTLIRALTAFALPWCLHASAHAQVGHLDSLRALLDKNAGNDAAFAIIASDIAQAFNATGETDSMSRYATWGIRTLERSDAIDKRRARVLMRLYKLRGIARHVGSDYDSSLTDFQRMYRYAAQLASVPDMGAALTYQGYQFRETGDYPNAIRITKEAIAVLAPEPDGPDMANAYMGLGSAYADVPDTDSSLYWLEKAAVLYRAQGNDHHLLNTFANMGETYASAGRFAEADSIWESAGALVAEVEDPVAFVHYAAGHARVLMRKGRSSEAIPLLDSAFDMASGMEYLNAVHQLAYMRSLARAGAGDWEEAFMDMKRSMDAHTADMDYDKIRSTEAIRQQAEREKEQAIARAELSKQRVQKWGALAIGALALLLALVWYRSYRAKSRAAQELLRKNQEIQQAQARLVESEREREAEQVRTRIARDIHDEIGATLTKIRLLSDVAISNDASQLEATRHSLERIGDHARHVGQAMSDIVWAVDPSRDTHQGMLDHVRDLNRRLLGDNGIRYDLDLSCTVGEAAMEPDLRRDLHLLINEAYNNILKYAKADHVSTRLKLNSYRFELEIQDNGVGFDMSLVHGAGNGLRNMRERVARYDGVLEIVSAPGAGTRIKGDGRF